MYDCEFLVHTEENITLINATRYRCHSAAVKRMGWSELTLEFSFEVASLLAIHYGHPGFTPIDFHVSTTRV